KECHILDNDITVTTNGTVYLYGHYNYQYKPKFNDNKIIINGNGTNYIYAAAYYVYGAEVIGNTIKMLGSSGTKTLYAGYQYSRDNFEFSDNDIEVVLTSSGSPTFYIGYYNSDNAGYNKYYNNKIRVSTASGSMTNYFAYQNLRAEIVGNDIDIRGTSTIYAAYAYSVSTGDGPWIVKNNKVAAVSTSGTVYAMYNYYAAKLELMNNVFYARSSGTHYPYLGGYNNNGAKVYNNTFHSDGSGSSYPLYFYEYTGSQFADIKNN